MSDQLRGRSALVTGASRGIGRAIAIGLAAHGTPDVVVGYLSNRDRAAEVVDTITSAGGVAVAVGAGPTTTGSSTRTPGASSTPCARRPGGSTTAAASS